MLVKIRPDMPLDKAALIGCGVTTGVGAVLNTAKVRPGDVVAVIGCGGIGLNAIQAAAIVGAGRIIAVDRVASKLDLALTFGATDVVDASAGDPVGAVLELTGGGVDHAFEAIGLAATAQQAFNMLRKGGTATVIGMIPLGEQVEIDGFQLLLEKRLQGSNMGSNRFRIDMPQYIEWYLAGKLKLDELVSARDAARADQRRLRRAARPARSPASSSRSTSGREDPRPPAAGRLRDAVRHRVGDLERRAAGGQSERSRTRSVRLRACASAAAWSSRGIRNAPWVRNASAAKPLITAAGSDRRPAPRTQTQSSRTRRTRRGSPRP